MGSLGWICAGGSRGDHRMENWLVMPSVLESVVLLL